MILDFACDDTESVFTGGKSKRFSTVRKVAERKLQMLDSAVTLEFLRSPPGNYLEAFVEATRTIPLTPYLAQHLATLPRRNGYVFASNAKVGRITEPRASHARVLLDAAIEGLTIHGLRRSF